MSLKSSNMKQTNTYELEIAVDSEKFTKAVDNAYKKQVKKINVPGFRKGKAPKSIIEKMYGEDVFYDDAIQECYPEALENAAAEANLKIVSVEDLKVIEVNKESFTFNATIIVEPEIEIEGYKGIEYTEKSTKVTEELIDKEIDAVRERNSRMITVEDRPVQDGDIAVIDFEGFLDGEAFEGGKAENYNLKIGGGQFIPGFEEQIIGHNTDEEFSINVTFPEDYQAENLAGKETEFKIKLHEIKAKQLPEVDDEFVKDVSDKETLDEYKEELKETVAKRLEEEAKKDKEDQLTSAVIELVKGEIPEQMYDNQVNTMLREFEMRLSQQGLDINTYMQYMGSDIDSLKEMYKPEAEKRVKLRLALEKIVKIENIVPDEKDIEEEYSRLAEMYKMETDKIKDIIPAEGLSQDIAVEKAMELVKETSVAK